LIRELPSGLDPLRFPTEPWRVVETEPSFDDLGHTETIFAVGNGYLGLRGNPEEGREAHSHGTFINGFHETWPIKHAEEAYGFAKTGQTMLNVPDAKLIKLYVDDEPLIVVHADLDAYERVLDMRVGTLDRCLVWRTPSGKRVQVRSRRMVSFEHRHLAVFCFEVTLLDAAAPVVISSQLLNRLEGEDEYHVEAAALGEGFDDPRRSSLFEHRVLQPKEQRIEGDRVVLGYRVDGSGMTLAVATHHLVEADCPVTWETNATDDVARTVVQAVAQPGQAIRLVKFASYHSSRGVPSRELANRCERTIDRGMSLGLDALVEEQRAWLDEWWRHCDVRIEGDDRLQQAVRFSLFHLAQATARCDTVGVPAKGVTGGGYEGHYFWDTEVYVVPFLAYTSPQIARNLLRFRYQMLPKARQRAVEVNQMGALFPWRTIDGDEASAYYQAGTAQYHINADVMFALRRYVQATGDADLLFHEGVEMLVETARLWADLGFHRGADDAFHIFGVTGPDEYTTMVNDNLFTNVMARFNLRYAADTVDRLGAEDPVAYLRLVKRVGLDPGELEVWRRAADHMYEPYDADLGIHPQDEAFLEKEVWDFEATPPDRYPLLLHFHPLVIYRFQVLKQADVVLAMWLLGENYTVEQKRRNFDYYDPITTGDSSLSASVQCIQAAEAGYLDLADRYFRVAAYMDLSDVHGNSADGAHVASMAGVWAAAVYGFGGMRDHNGMLEFEPRLGTGWDSLAFTLTWRGRRLDVGITPERTRIEVCEGDPVPVQVAGIEYQVSAGAPLEVGTAGAAGASAAQASAVRAHAG
jgi:alpha,alpha-trehalose phosphorylase